MSNAIYPHDVKALREGRLHLTQAQFADLVGVSLSTVSKWETGNAVPKGARERMIRRLMTEHPPQRESVTVSETVGTYDGAITTWERERTERRAAGEPTGLADKVLRVLRTTRETLLKTATDD